MLDTPRVGNLMVVDDDETTHFLYKRIIKRSNLVDDVVFYAWAEDALAHLRRTDTLDIQMILLDINMPRMNGFEFLEAANKEFGGGQIGAAVVVLTTSLNPTDEARAKSFDLVKGYLEKPLTLEQIDLLSDIVHRSQTHKRV